MKNEKIVELRVSSSTATNSLGSCIDRYINEGKGVALCAVGVRAVNQAIKAIAVACRYARNSGRILTVEPYFENIIDRDSKEKVIRLKFITHITSIEEDKDVCIKV